MRDDVDGGDVARDDAQPGTSGEGRVGVYVLFIFLLFFVAELSVNRNHRGIFSSVNTHPLVSLRSAFTTSFTPRFTCLCLEAVHACAEVNGVCQFWGPSLRKDIFYIAGARRGGVGWPGGGA